MDDLSLVKKLISISSYVSETNNERAIAEFVFSYLKEIPFVKVRKQFISTDRFNVIAETKGRSKLLVAGHLDTVRPQHTIKIKKESSKRVGDRLYGLGALDTKGGVAMLLRAIKGSKVPRGLTALFYCDEEYDFKGIKKYISSKKDKPGELAIFVEPTNLNIWNAHKGLVEFTFSVKGKTGHAANPQSGINAITSTFVVLTKLQQIIRSFKDSVLGESTCTISYVNGGVCRSIDKNVNIIVENGGNVIPNYVTFSVDVRTTHTDLNSAFVKEFIKKSLVGEGCQLINLKVTSDMRPMRTDRRSLEVVERIQREVLGNVRYLNPRVKGYGDGQLIQEKFNIPVIYLGPSGDNPHSADEYVTVSSFKKLETMYSRIIGELCR